VRSSAAWRAGCETLTQPTLLTERITLVPLAEEHFELELELDSQAEVMRYLTGRALTREEVRKRHERRIGIGKRAPGLGFWSGFVRDDFVGWWVLEPPERDEQRAIPGQAELGYRLLPRFWRQGLGSEGARALLRYGFEVLRLDRIIAETMTVNAASRATMQSVGLRFVRTFHVTYDEPLPGSEKGEVEYAITRDEWVATASTPDRGR
jgi:RimJ/RimL family protein N-acetyltransferase